VVLVDGSLVASLRAGEGEIATFLPAEEPSRSRAAAALARALARWSAGRSAVVWMSVDGEPVARSGIASFLRDAGFVPSGPGMRMSAGYAEAGEEPAESAEDETEPERADRDTEADG
jgi:hypothetical protein